MVLVNSEVKNKLLVSGDSRVEEVYRQQTSITSHKVHQNCGGVRHPQPEFLGASGLVLCYTIMNCSKHHL